MLAMIYYLFRKQIEDIILMFDHIKCILEVVETIILYVCLHGVHVINMCEPMFSCK